jgi:hypothetical protein
MKNKMENFNAGKLALLHFASTQVLLPDFQKILINLYDSGTCVLTMYVFLCVFVCARSY